MGGSGFILNPPMLSSHVTGHEDFNSGMVDSGESGGWQELARVRAFLDSARFPR